MPKRTRTQKEQAQRRKTSVPTFTIVHEDVHPEPEATRVTPILSDTDLRAIKRDLVKIAVLTLIALGSQLILYGIS